MTIHISPLQVEWHGQLPYPQAWDLQKSLVAERVHNPDLPDKLLLLEHPPTYTLGRSGHEANLLLSPAEQEQAGITVHHVDRGGDITYHGPGQLVGYPILNLKRLHQARGYPRPDLHHYLRDIEELLIQTLAHYQLTGWRYKGYTGVWLTTPDGPRKIAAIGIHVNHKGITSHGFALNVDPNMEHFAGIIPCGIQEHGVTSLAQQLPTLPPLPAIRQTITTHFQQVIYAP